MGERNPKKTAKRETSNKTICRNIHEAEQQTKRNEKNIESAVMRRKCWLALLSIALVATISVVESRRLRDDLVDEQADAEVAKQADAVVDEQADAAVAKQADAAVAEQADSAVAKQAVAVVDQADDAVVERADNSTVDQADNAAEVAEAAKAAVKAAKLAKAAKEAAKEAEKAAEKAKEAEEDDDDDDDDDDDNDDDDDDDADATKQTTKGPMTTMKKEDEIVKEEKKDVTSKLEEEVEDDGGDIDAAAALTGDGGSDDSDIKGNPLDSLDIDRDAFLSTNNDIEGKYNKWDTHCTTLREWGKYPCKLGWRHGCDEGVCFSQCNAAWPENTLTVEWCWVEDENENYIPCKTHADCTQQLAYRKKCHGTCSVGWRL